MSVKRQPKTKKQNVAKRIAHAKHVAVEVCIFLLTLIGICKVLAMELHSLIK